MFLRIATVFAILGLLFTLILAIAQQTFLTVGYYSPGMRLIYKVITLGGVVSFTVPLMIFFVAFLLAGKTK